MRNGRKIALALGLLCLLGLAFRSLPQRRAFHRGQVFLFGSDAWCHLRRIDYAADNKLALPEPDPMLNYPEGTFTYWGWLFDRLGALAVMAAGVPSGLSRERFLAWYPAVLGALCVIPAFFLGALLIPRGPPKKVQKGQKVKKSSVLPIERLEPFEPLERFNLPAGLLTAFFVAALPGAAEYSMLGHLDHHVMESLLFGCLAAGFAAMRLSGKRLFIALSTLFLLLIYLQHPAISNLYAALFWFLCLLEIYRSRYNVQSSAGIQKAWIPFAITAVLMLPSAFYYLNVEPTGLLSSPVAQLPRWMLFQQYSFLQPVFLAFCAATLWMARILSTAEPPASGSRPSPGVFWPLALAGIAALACAAFLALPVYKGLLVLFRADPLLKFTAESMPILFPHTGSGFKPVFAHQMFGWLFLAFPAWWAFSIRSKKNENLFFAAFCGILLLMVLLQLRFVYLFSFAMALALAHVIQEIKAMPDAVWRRAAWIVLLLSFIPCVKWWHSLSKGSRFRYLTITDSQYDTFSWFRHNTPAVKGYDNVKEKPEWSVLASWDQGHAIVYLGRRAVVADPLNHGMKESIGYYSSIDPREAVNILISKGVRYVMAMDMSEPVAQEMHAGSLELPESHPLRTGDWLRLFQMRLLMNLPIPGPDGHPFYWGHRLVHLSDSGKDAIFEFNPAAVKDFKPRRLVPKGREMAVAGGSSYVFEKDIQDWMAVQSCYPNRTVSREEAFRQVFRQSVLEALFHDAEISIHPEEYLKERERIDRETRAPEILSCIKKKTGNDTSRYERVYIRPLLSTRALNELVSAQGWQNEFQFFRAASKIPYRIYDAALENWMIRQDDPFLSALNHGE